MHPTKLKSTEWAEALQQQVADRRRLPKGDGWLTPEQIGEQLNLKRSATSDFLARELRAGRVEFFNGSDISPAGDLRVKRWYRRISKTL